MWHQIDLSEKSGEVDARAALLDFYSSRAVAHASYFIASIFGIVTLLALSQNIGRVPFQNNILWDWLAVAIWFIVYAIFAYMGYYTLGQFSKYAAYADTLRASSLALDAHLEDIKISLDESGKTLWEGIFRNQIGNLRNQKKFREAEKAEKDLEEMRRTLKVGFKYYDIDWGQMQGRLWVKKFIRSRSERAARARYGRPQSKFWRLRALTHWTNLYWLLMVLLAVLAIYQIFIHAK